MKLLIFIVLFSLSRLSVSGQDWNIINDDIRMLSASGGKVFISIDDNEGIQGTPYMNDEFVTGALIGTDSLMYQNVPLRYNIFRDEMEFLVQDDIRPMVIANPRNFLYIFIDANPFVYLSFKENNKARNGYFELLNSGECQVLVRRNTVFAGEKKPQGYSDGSPARFEPMRSTYYLRFGRQLPEEISLRRHSILAAFNQKQTEIATFVRENNLSYRNETDLVKMAELYNQLITDSTR